MLSIGPHLRVACPDPASHNFNMATVPSCFLVVERKNNAKVLFRKLLEVGECGVVADFVRELIEEAPDTDNVRLQNIWTF